MEQVSGTDIYRLISRKGKTEARVNDLGRKINKVGKQIKKERNRIQT